MSNNEVSKKSDKQQVEMPVQGRIRASGSGTVNVTIRGRAGGPVDLYYLDSGATMGRFRLAVTRRGRDEAGTWHDMDTTWYSVKMWNQLAQNAAHSVKKGDPIITTGRLSINEWEDEASQKKNTELVINASTVGHDLAYGVSNYAKPMRVQRDKMPTVDTNVNEVEHPKTDEAQADPLGVGEEESALVS
ncbi:single-stranded DNA-binding protein [Gleimia hominis]|uniref:single-stranded DNA-binding protein n=1 Tax=Gleimia hominis TaxID=595468 RepID=UPI0011AF1F5E|nr:single-stranded DNA-binding protein [Gleimia hominis]WIK64865.1 single-stranded DNA-binding protein [Gleimia hominis]